MMKIILNYITKGTTNRPGTRLKSVKGIVVHWIGVAQPSALVIRNNFNKAGRVGSTQFVLGYNGEIIQTMPDNERAQHVGADKYTALKERICGKDNPNNHLIGIECCIKAGTPIPVDYSSKMKYLDMGEPSEVQYRNLVEFLAKKCKEHKLDPLTQIYRHYDITGKPCHVYYYKNEKEWVQLKKDVKRELEGDDEVVKKIKIKINGQIKEVNTMLKDGSNFVKLRDIADSDITVDYDAKAKMPIVKSK